MIAVAAPALIIAALLALAFMLAWQQWGQAVSNTLNVNLPVVGRVLGGLIIDALNAAYFASVYLLDGVVAPLGEAILRPIAAVENNIAAAYTSAVNSYVAIYGIVHTRIPAVLNSAVGYTNTIVSEVRGDLEVIIANTTNALYAALGVEHAFALQVYSAATSYTDSLVSLVRNNLEVLISDAVTALDAGLAAEHTFALSVYTQATAFTQHAYDLATAYASNLAVVAAQNLATATTELEGYADATATHAVGVLVTDIDQSIGAALGGIYTDIDTAISDVVGVIGTGDAEILAGIRAIPATIPLDIAGVAALAGATTLTLTRYLRDCGIPNCQNLSQFGNDLNGLSTILTDGAFLGLIGELIHDPSSAHTIYDDTLGPVVSTGIDAARSLLSV